MAGPFTYPVAWSTPFESEPERSNGFESDNVQEAIEEALRLAVSNDVFMTLAQYNGNANVGRHLEFYVGIDSEVAPLYFSKGSNVIAIAASTTAANVTCKIGFFNNASLTPNVPLYEVEFTADKRVIVNGTPASPIFILPIGAELEIRVTEGSIAKPHMQVVYSSSLPI